MKGRAVVQANPFAEIGQSNPVAVARHFFQNGKGAANRLHSAARPILNVIIDIRQGIFDNACDRRTTTSGTPSLRTDI
jgi:hypothetical protein